MTQIEPSLEKQTEIAKMFDSIAKRYDLLNHLLSMGIDKYWRRELIKNVPFGLGGHYLDVATGTGDVILNAAKHRPTYDSYIGVDISANMLEIAKKKSMKHPKADRMQFKLGSASELQLTSNEFSCVSIAFGLRNVVQTEQAIKEFYRVLKPGSPLLILEFFPSQDNWFAKTFKFYFHKILPKIGGLFSDSKAYHYLPNSVEQFYSLDELQKVLTEVGFKKIHTKSFLFGSCQLIKANKASL